MQTNRWSSSVHLQGSDSGHQHHHVRSQAWVAALDVEELLHADVSTEASLSHCWATLSMVLIWYCNTTSTTSSLVQSALETIHGSSTRSSRKNPCKHAISYFLSSTYLQSPRVQPASKLFYQPGWRSCHGRCWQTGQHGQTQGFPADSDDSHVTQYP